MILNNKRLVITDFTEQDFDLFYSLFSNESVMEYAVIDFYQSQEQAYPYFSSILAHHQESQDRSSYELAVYQAIDHQFIGFVNLVIYLKNQSGGFGEIGYFILPEYWGLGFATEAAESLCHYAFNQLGLHKICASCHINNKASENIMKKLGMVKEGEFKKTRFKKGLWYTELKYAVLLEDWKRKN